jgi:3-keto-5-aminohexanoate cleavage enzyme
MMKPIVIVAAVNGGYHLPDEHTSVPISPKEIAEEAAKCRENGAAIVHFHARDEAGMTTGDPAVFTETIRQIREKSDILIQTTNGIGMRKDASGVLQRPTIAERLALLDLKPAPDLYGAAAGSTDYTHPYGGQPNERPYINDADWLRASIRHAFAVGSTIEFEVVHMQSLYRLKRMADEGVFDAEAPNVWLTHGAGIAYSPATARYVVQSIEEGKHVFPKSLFGVMGCGPHQFPVSAMGLACECDSMRIGLEDNLFMPNGERARSNHQLIAEAVKLAAFFNRRPATPAEARELLCSHR